ncbi:anti-phage deoxyguanosine triphosphatase [Paludifilum halophilum]|uniref:Deoxyguanosinetriphosphate triphosphohydrolase-like protein n=1 Tax=Paludifilum halophilum TaxID=1642702 RepID=A0A235BE58_9BACL|nr:anti-phage deoxyguanosine triphosphatase [Paludifilum halophilum]OYD09885.1 hypothetical protein CHM34_02600 [Paludifilum halophilum]
MLLTDRENPFYSKEDRKRRFGERSRSNREIRDDFERDYGRIIHSAAFRRLQAKKQVIGTEVGDFHRTRLTHSLETAQIARGIALSLNHRSERLQEGAKIDISLVEAASLAHDLGHPPFGHEGERALNGCMLEEGGFEGNAHTFRLLTRLEGKKGEGLNLTRGLLMAVLKYPIVYDEELLRDAGRRGWPPKASIFNCDRETFEWVLAPLSEEERAFYLEQKEPSRLDCPQRTLNLSFECSIVELADDIAYATHDLEDAINLQLVECEELQAILTRGGYGRYEEVERAAEVTRFLNPRREDFKSDLKQLFAFLISAFVNRIEMIQVGETSFRDRLKYRAVLPDDLKELNARLKEVVEKRVIHSPQVRAMGWRGERVVRMLFDAYREEMKLLPENDRKKIERNPDSRLRVVCDYIAGMTDPFALKMYDRLYGSGRGV